MIEGLYHVTQLLFLFMFCVGLMVSSAILFFNKKYKAAAMVLAVSVSLLLLCAVLEVV